MKKRIALRIICGIFFVILVAPASAFVKIGEGGFEDFPGGSSANSYSWSVLPFKGNLYVGTNRHHLHSMMEALSFMGAPISPDILPQGLLPDPPPSYGLPPYGAPQQYWFTQAWAEDFRGEIWRYNKEDKWVRVYQSGIIPIGQGKYAPNAYGYRAMAEFNGYLYACGIGTWMPPMPMNTILRSKSGDPGTWENVSGAIAQTTNIRAITEWNGKLHVAVTINADPATGMGGQAVVYASEDPESKPWIQVSLPGFGGNNSEIYYLTAFDNHLYASTVNLVSGFELWKTDGKTDTDGKYIWTQVIRNGFGDTWNQYGMTMAAFGDYLYLGTAVGIGMVMKDGQVVGTRPIEIIRVDKNDNAQLVVGARQAYDPIEGGPYPRVPLSGIGAGFGNPFNVYAWNMNVFKNCLYVGTLDLSIFVIGAIQNNPDLLSFFTSIYAPEDLDFSDDIVEAIVNNRFTPEILELMKKLFGGGDLWKSCDGKLWYPVTLNGFGNPLNYGIREVVAVKKDGKDKALAVGTANPFTGRPDGGCEVWLGDFDGDSGWSYGPRYTAKGNWATYTAYDNVPKTVILFAGQTKEAGTVSFSAPVSNKVTITVSLNRGWFFEPSPENVKIQDYNTVPPARNPSPGQFVWKGNAMYHCFSLTVPQNKFYGVHVDLLHVNFFD
jgi:hypothetical protein